MPAVTHQPPKRPTTRSASRMPREARVRADRVLFARRDQGDQRARDELVERFLPLARSIARRYETSTESFDDLVQVASLALVKAVDRYDPARGFAFSTYAVPTISGEIKRHFRDRTWAIRPPRELGERVLRLQTAVGELTTRLDRAPTVPELAVELGMTSEQILEAIHVRRMRDTVSLQAPRGEYDDGHAIVGDTLGRSEPGFAQVETRLELDALLRLVAPRSRVVLRLRYERDLTQAEIATLLGISQMQVSRIIRAAISQLGAIVDSRCAVTA